MTSHQSNHTEPHVDSHSHKQSGDVFAFLSRFLPKRTDVLWVAQELERIHRLPDLQQRTQAQGKLYEKIERHIISSQPLDITAQTLREKIRSQFRSEVESGFLQPVFEGTSPKEDLPAPSAKPLAFSRLKQTPDTEAHAVIETSEGAIPVSIKGASWETGNSKKRQFVLAIKDVRTAEKNARSALEALYQALQKARSGDTSALTALEAQSEGLAACIKIIKEFIHTRQKASGQPITQLPKPDQLIANFKEVSTQLEEKETELVDMRRAAVKRELSWQSRIVGLEQAKRAATVKEMELQQHIARLEQEKQIAQGRTMELERRVAAFEKAMQAGEKRQQHVARMKQEIEAFYKKLSQSI